MDSAPVAPLVFGETPEPVAVAAGVNWGWGLVAALVGCVAFWACLAAVALVVA